MAVTLLTPDNASTVAGNPTFSWTNTGVAPYTLKIDAGTNWAAPAHVYSGLTGDSAAGYAISDTLPSGEWNWRIEWEEEEVGMNSDTWSFTVEPRAGRTTRTTRTSRRVI